MAQSDTQTLRLRRAMLFMPGDSLKKIEKGATSGVDSVIMDLEDGCALSQKAEGRKTILHALQNLDFGRTEKLIRINPVDSGMEMDDLVGTLEGKPDGYVIPKVESATQIERINSWLSGAERGHGWQKGIIRIFALIESAAGVVNLKDISQAADRLVALMFGAEDLAASIGAIRTASSMEVFYGRSAVVIHARAAGLQAIDSPWMDIHNLEGLEAETRQIMGMGYDGKMVIHPKHVPVIEQVFRPSDEEITRAKILIQAHEEHQKSGAGVFAFEGKMVDMPMIRAAETVLARAQIDES